MTTMIVVALAIVACALVASAYSFYRRRFRHWRDRDVPYLTPTMFFGNLSAAASTNVGVIIRGLYERSRGERFVGAWFFHKPTLIVNDLDLVKDVLVKSFANFHDHGVYHDAKADPVSAHLFAIEGSEWRNIRAKLSPTFTSGKMKMMFPMMRDCARELADVARRSPGAIEVKDLIARFTTDIISSCAFGIETNSLKNPNAEFRTMGRKIFEATWSNAFRNMAAFMVPDWARFLKLRVTPKAVGDFFVGVMRETMEFRKRNGVRRNDFLQLLMGLMSDGYDDVDDPKNVDRRAFTFEQAVPEAFVFFLGGFETSSTAMQFALYELATNPDVQDKLRTEVRAALAESNGEMTYENVHGMEYMGRVIEETLRKHPPAPFLIRECTKAYAIPGTKVTLEKGTSLTIPTYGFHMDEKYFPEPERFDPDRFLDERKGERHHFAYLPFGDGPRVCIGQRFAIMQMRIALAAILSEFVVEVAGDGLTPESIVYDHKVFVLTAKGGMHLRISPLRA